MSLIIEWISTDGWHYMTLVDCRNKYDGIALIEKRTYFKEMLNVRRPR